MRLYTGQHRFYCGIDLHARLLAVCILDQAGAIVYQRQLPAEPQALLDALAPFRPDVVVAVECLFAWYWVADLCRREGLPFVLGHALYMRLIHGGKTKNDDLDAEKIARLLRGGNIPLAYVYPKGLRETRDLLRRRNYLVRKRAELITHVQILNSQYNLPPFGKKLTYAANRAALKVPERFADPQVRKSAEVDLALVDRLDQLIGELELYLVRTAKVEDAQTYHRLQTIPGVGKILALIFLYEIHDIGRFAEEGDFLSYARLVSCPHASAGKRVGTGGRKIGNAHLKWAFSEAVCLLIRCCPGVKLWQKRLEKKHGVKKTLGIVAARLGRTVYVMLRRQVAFDLKRFLRQEGAVRLPLLCCRWEVLSMAGIDFRSLRERVPLGQVLELVGFAPTVRRGPCVRGPCPVHGGQPGSRAFAAHLEWHCWHCFRCGAGGNALDLWLAVSRLPPYEGALALCARLGLDVPRLPVGRRAAARSPPVR